MTEPRPASSYRAARRNLCLRTKPRGVWGPDWYLRKHRAHYARGMPNFGHNPGRYPRTMLSVKENFVAYRKQMKALWKAAMMMAPLAAQR